MRDNVREVVLLAVVVSLDTSFALLMAFPVGIGLDWHIEYLRADGQPALSLEFTM
jgi:hypothetical protein